MYDEDIHGTAPAFRPAVDIAYHPVAVWNSRMDAAKRREREDRPALRQGVAGMCTIALLVGMLMTILGSSLTPSVVLRGDGPTAEPVAVAPTAPSPARPAIPPEMLSVTAAPSQHLNLP